MADIISNAPRLSLAERDRRWAKTRALMAEHSVDVLLVPGLRGRESYESYLSNESIQGIVVLPADRDPIYLTWSAFRIVGRTRQRPHALPFRVRRRQNRAGRAGGRDETIDQRGVLLRPTLREDVADIRHTGIDTERGDGVFHGQNLARSGGLGFRGERPERQQRIEPAQFHLFREQRRRAKRFGDLGIEVDAMALFRVGA